MVRFRVVPHPSEAQVLQGQNLARTMYSIGADAGGGGIGRQNVPVFLGVVMDQSGSMEGSKLESAKEALIRLLHEVPDNDSVVVHITLFSDYAEELMPARTGREIEREMGSLTS
ncbi:MAG TPA: vWA domain-containing protein, partial [Chloroflexia bacterium]|nr:vWA domain-containing protein [Chloroflexia bacterium]